MKKITFLLILAYQLTQVAAQTVVFTEGFETLPLSVTSGGTPGWERSTYLKYSGSYSDSSRVVTSSNSYLTTNGFSTLGNTFVILEFAHICKIEFFDAGEVEVSVDNGLTWTKLGAAQYLGNGQFASSGEKFTSTAYPIWDPGTPSTVPQNTWWRVETFDLSSLASNQASVQVRFKLSDGNGQGDGGNYGWLLDDIKVTVASSELIPPAITLNVPITQDTIIGTGPFDVSAEITDASGIDTAYVVYTINGTTTDSIGLINTTGNTYAGQIPSMPYNTHIDYRVKARDNATVPNTGISNPYWFYTKKASSTATIGTGSLVPTYTLYSPIYRYSSSSSTDNSVSNIIYTQQEMADAGIYPGTSITSIAFDKNGTGGTNSNPLAFSIYMANSSNTPPLSTTTTWGNILASHTLVYTNANQVIPTTTGWVEFVLTTPFTYTGGSLEIATSAAMSASSNWTTDKFDWKYTDGYATYCIAYVSTTTIASSQTLSSTTSGYKHRPNIKMGLAATSYTTDAGIKQITQPTGVVITNTPTPVMAVLKNFGTSDLTTANIKLSVNGTLQQTTPWAGLLSQDMVTFPMPVGNATFGLGSNILKVWSDNPNNTADLNNINDTTTITLWGCDAILNGSYTINPGLPTGGTNFNTVNEAIDAVNLCGVSGPVDFTLSADTFNTRMVFNGDIPGASATNTVTFKGTNGTVLKYGTSVSADRAIVLVNGAKYLRFDSLTVFAPDSTYGWGFHIYSQSEDIQITNCVVKTATNLSSINHSGIVVSGSYTSATTGAANVKNISILNNTITGGYYGISTYGLSANRIPELVISGNTVSDVYYHGIYCYYAIAPVITGNTAETRSTGTTTTSGAGLYLGYADGPFDVSSNKFTNLGQYGIYVTSSDALTGTSSRIYNNALGGGFRNTTSSYGLYISSCDNLDLYYNSANCDGIAGRGIYITSATGMKVLNNSFSFTGTGAGYAAYYGATTYFIEHNYNHYYSTGTNFVYYGSAKANLAALQATNIPVGNDLNSVAGNPLHSTNTYLYPLGSLLNNAATPITGITNDILGTTRNTTPDIGAYEFEPSTADIALIEGELVNSTCLSNNDSLYLTINNVIGGTIDFNVHPLSIVWNVTGPLNSSDTIVLNTGTLASGSNLIIGSAGVDMSQAGTYVLSAYLEPNGLNSLTLNDTLNNAATLIVAGYVFNATPDSVFITSPVDTVMMSVTSNMFPEEQFFITEVCHYKYTTGDPVNGWPTYLLADDYIEITGPPGADLAFYTLEQWTSTALSSTYTFPAGTVLSPLGTAIIAVGQPNTSVPSPANFYYHANVGTSWGSTAVAGRILKSPSGNIIDAVGYGTYTFPVAAGVTPADWTGNTPASSSASGNRLIGPDVNNATSWVGTSTTYLQNPNEVNNGVIVPAPAALTAFTWSLNGTVASYNNSDTVVGPYVANGLYQYVAEYTTSCSTLHDTVNVYVNIPPHDLVVDNILSPVSDICYAGNEAVSIEISNHGADTLFGGFTAAYTIGGGTPVTENVSDTIAPGHVLVYTFTSPINFVLNSTDSAFFLNTYVHVNTDPYQQNDTLGSAYTFYDIPNTPVGTPDTINYGSSATLAASANGNIFWYDNLSAQIPIASGDTFNTQPLFATTTFYAEASNNTPQSLGLPASFPTASSGAGTTNYGLVFDVIVPTVLRSVTVYPVSSTGASGTVTIDIINASGTVLHTATANVTGSPTATPVPHVINLDFNLQPGTNLKMRPAYTGISGLLYEPTAGAPPSGNYGYPFEVSGIISINHSTLTAHPTNTARLDLYYYFYNWKVEVPGCFSNRIPVEAYVNIPQFEPGITAITSPIDESCSDNSETVSVMISNSGSDAITTGLTATYIVNNGTPVTEPVNVTVPAGDTVLFSFGTPINLNLTTGDTTLDITAYVTLSGDPYHGNDTLSSSFTVSFTPLAPIADHDTVAYGSIATIGALSSNNITWYATPTSTTVIDTGATLTTPPLYGNTAYYAVASEGSGSAFVGAYDLSIGTSSDYANTTYYLIFDVLNPMGTKIKAIDVFPSTAPGAAYQIQLLNSSGTVLDTYDGVTTVASGSRERAPVDFNVPFGTNYRIKFGVSAGMWRNTTGATYPYTIPGEISITGNSFSGYPEYYYFFYNWEVSSGSGCESPRTEVWAIVTGNPAVDAGVVSVDLPVSPTDLQPQNATVTIQNFGTTPLTSVTINWTNNGVAQLSFPWNGNLATNATTQVNIGTFTPVLGFNNLVVWTSNPNGVTDPMAINDTAQATIESFEPLCGLYTIGGVNADFPTFAGATYALENYGISCPVTFKVNQGFYPERVVLENYTGVSATNTVTFEGQAGAVINYEPTTSNERAVILLDGAQYINLDSLIISIPSSAAYGFGIHVTNASSNIEITNCTVNTVATSSSTNYAGIVVSNSLTSATTTGNSANNVLIQNNTVTGGYYGITSVGASATNLNNIKIYNNTINDVYYYGIYSYYLLSAEIRSNLIKMRSTGTTTTSSYGIYVYYHTGPFFVTKNRIYDAGTYGIYVSSSDAVVNKSIIANNMIGGGFKNLTSTSAAGIYITGSDNIGIYYNSINMNAPKGNGLYALSTATVLDIRNNSFAYTGNDVGYAMNIATPANVTGLNYNNYYSNGSKFVKYNTDMADLAALKAVNVPLGNDTSSLQGNPYYFSATNLHALTTQLYQKGTPIAGITEDFDGELRNTLTPCIGADEFVPANIDAAPVALVAPESTCNLTSAEQISVIIANFGLTPFNSITLTYSVNNGALVSQTFTQTVQPLSTDTFTFNTTYDFSAYAVYNLKVTAILTGDQVNVNDTMTYVINTGHDLYVSTYTMGFELNEDYSNWTVVDVDNDARTWEPGYSSTTYSNTGSYSARFYNQTTSVNGDWLFSPCFTLEGGKSYKIEFWYRAESATYPQNLALMLGTDNLPVAMTDTLINLVGFNNNTHQLASAIVNIPSNGVYYFGWYAYSTPQNWYLFIDDINIRLLEAKDAAVVSIDNLDSHVNSGSVLIPEVTLKNWGSDTLTVIPVKYTVNGGAPTTETWTGTLLPDSTVSFTFTTGFTVPTGDFELCSYTQLPNDGNTANDTTCATAFGIPLINLPFADNFDGTTYFYTMGANNQWQLGIPTASTINSAHSPSNVWATNLSGDYAANSNYFLYSPRFSFNSITNVMLSMWHWIDSETDTDGGRIQYTTNNGNTWQYLGTVNDTLATNWYNSPSVNGAPAFTGQSGTWVHATYDLSQFNNYPVPVQFRFNFFANGSIHKNGWALDDFELVQSAIAQDAGVISIVSPATQIVTGMSTPVEVVIENFGTDTLFTIPVRYRINNGVPVNDTWNGILVPGATVNFTFTTPIIQTDTFDFCAYTKVVSDIYTTNDSSCTTVNVIPAQFDAGVTEITAPVTSTILNQPVSVTVKIKNFGTEPLTSFNVQYDINSGTPVSQTWTGNLVSGAETTFNFTQTYISPSGNYILCAKTNLTNDQNLTNDKTCKNLTGTVGIDNIANEGLLLGQNIPNPVSHTTMIEYTLPEAGYCNITLVNILGQTIYSENLFRNKGSHTLELNVSNIPAGMYFYTLGFKDSRITLKMTISR